MNHVGRLAGVRFHEVAPRALSFWRRLPDNVMLALLVALVYYVGCLAGFALRFPSSGISFFWPPTAVLTVALLVAPFKTWPVLLASSFVAHAIAHWQDGIPIAAWPIQFFGNASQAALAAWLLRRYSTTPGTFASTRSVLAFILGAGMLAPAAASLIPAYVYVSLGWAADLLQAWRVRAISNAIAMLTIVPPLLVTWRFLSTRPALVPRRIVEFALLLLGVAMAHVVVHYTVPSHPLGMGIVLYAPIPLLIWAAVRFGVAGVAFALLATALVTISIALSGHGPLRGRVTADTVIVVQLILVANAIPMMLLAGGTEQSRREHASLIDVEHQNSTILRAGGIGVWEFDVRTGAVRVQGSLKQSLGYEEHEIGDSFVAWQDHIFAADREDVTSRLRALAHGTADTFESEFRLLHRDGSVRWLTSKGALTDKHDGQVARVRGTYIDVTDRKEAARALRDANDALMRMGRVAAMAEVSASIAHELHQPLAAIIANASAGVQLIEQDTPHEELREVFADLLHDSRRAAQIIQHTRRMFTQRPTRARVLDLNDVVREIVEIATPRLHHADVILKVNLDERLPAVLADAVQIQQVLLNLVTNAVEAMRDVVDRPRRLQIATCHGRRHAIVSVRDTGHGLGATEAARIFQPFYTTRPGGTGMGLAISHTIISNHMGTLWAVHNALEGTTFRFKIPLHGATPRDIA